jgi:transcriptional regulator with XRE-family HTH domain
MTKQTRLAQHIKANRKLILANGYKQSTISMWAKGKRIPDYKDALLLSTIFKVDVNDLPYRRLIKNI